MGKVKVEQINISQSYYTVKDVEALLGCKRCKAQNVIRTLNDELETKGYMRYPLGKVPRVYFNERMGLTRKEA